VRFIYNNHNRHITDHYISLESMNGYNMKSNTLRIIIVLIWILLLLSGYYWGHKPIGTDTATNLFSLSLDLIIVILVVIASGALGRLVLRKAQFENLERVVLQAVLGMGLFSLLWLALGGLGLFQPLAAWIMLAGVLIFLYRQSAAWLTDFLSGIKTLGPVRGFNCILLALLAFLVVFQLFTALAPPVKYDALTYHLQLPRQYIQGGKLIFTPENPYWGHPQLGEMLFTWMMLLHRGQTAALLGAVWGILLLLGVLATTRSVVKHWYSVSKIGLQNEGEASLQAGLAAAAALLAGLTFRWSFGWAYTDLLSGLAGWAAIAVVFTAIQTRNIRLLPAAAIFCGFVIGVKWTGALLPAGLFLGLLFYRRKIGLSYSHLLLFGGLVLLTAVPWLAKNWLATGNPVYPYFLPSEWISSQRAAAASSGGVSLSFLQRLLFPLTSTFAGWDSAPGFGTDLGVLLALLGLPGLWFARKTRVGFYLILCLGLVWLTIGVGSHYFNHLQQPRLYFALLPAAGISAGLGWGGLSQLKIPLLRIGRILSVLMVLVLGFSLLQDVYRVSEMAPLQMIMGVESQQDYLERNLGMYALTMKSLHELAPGSKVLMLWEARGFYAPENAIADPWIDRWRSDFWRYGSVDSVLTSWHDRGVTHLLLYRRGMEAVRQGEGPLELDGWNTLDNLLKSLPEPVSFAGVYELYTLKR
jgi:hypothetical protein